MYVEKGNFVLVTTLYRGVFAGEVIDLNEKDFTIVLKDARCAIHWETTGGFLELASIGPNARSKIGPAVPQLTLYGVTSVAICSQEAVGAWRDHD